MTTTNLRSPENMAQEIGFLAMFTSNLGSMLISIMGALLGGDEITAHAISMKVDNLSAKLDILFAIAETHQKADRFAAAIMAEKQAILAAIALRNRLAHSIYIFDLETGDLQLYENLITDRRGKPKVTSLDASQIATTTAALREGILRIMRAGGSRITEPFGGHLGLPPLS